MRRRALMLPLVLLGALALSPAPSTGAEQPSRVIDRTFLCETGITGGIRQISLHASSADRGGPVTYGAGVDARTNLRPTWRLASVGEGSIELSPACRRSKARVPLTSRGLSGGLVSAFGDDYNCWAPRWVLVRARAAFRSRVTLRLGRPYDFPLLFARGRVKEGYLAIQTRAGKLIAFASASESGKARVFTSASCFE